MVDTESIEDVERERERFRAMPSSLSLSDARLEPRSVSFVARTPSAMPFLKGTCEQDMKCRFIPRDESILVQKLIRVITQQLWDELGIEQLLSTGRASFVRATLERYGTFIAIMSYLRLVPKVRIGREHLSRLRHF